jgi:hypothetical protein
MRLLLCKLPTSWHAPLCELHPTGHLLLLLLLLLLLGCSGT